MENKCWFSTVWEKKKIKFMHTDTHIDTKWEQQRQIYFVDGELGI